MSSYNDLNSYDTLVHNLNSRNPESFSLLNNNNGRFDSNGGGSIRDIKKVGGRILSLCNILIKFFDLTLRLSNYIVLHL